MRHNLLSPPRSHSILYCIAWNVPWLCERAFKADMKIGAAADPHSPLYIYISGTTNRYHCASICYPPQPHIHIIIGACRSPISCNVMMLALPLIPVCVFAWPHEDHRSHARFQLLSAPTRVAKPDERLIVGDLNFSVWRSSSWQHKF